MVKRDKQPEIEQVEQAFREIGDTLRRAAKNPDALDLRPKVKAWLLEQFGPNKTRGMKPVTEETIENASEVLRQQLALEQRAVPPVSDKHLETVREAVRQQWELEQQAKPTSRKGGHAEKIQGRRKSKQDGGDLPPH